MSEIHVAQLVTYPVKSCGGIDVPCAVVGPEGLEYDRQWMVTRENGAFLSQRTFPQLARVATSLTERDGYLTVSAPDHGSIHVPLNPSRIQGEEMDIDIFKKPGSGRTQGNEAAEFFSDYLGMNALLLRSSRPREVNPAHHRHGLSTQIGFADGAPVLLTSMASLRALGRAAGQSISMDRFRPNIVVDGDGLFSYDEDYWRDIEIGAVRMHVGWASPRCPMPNVDQSTGILPKPADRFVTKVLKDKRSGLDPKTGKQEVFFGQNLLPGVGRTAVLNILDPVAVIHQFEAPNFRPVDG